MSRVSGIILFDEEQPREPLGAAGSGGNYPVVW